MKMSIDSEADAIYIKFMEAEVFESEQVAPGVILDFDSEDNIIGIELLEISRKIRLFDPDKIAVEVSRSPIVKAHLIKN